MALLNLQYQVYFVCIKNKEYIRRKIKVFNLSWNNRERILETRKQRNKNFTEHIIVFLLNNLIWANIKAETKFYFLPIGRNKIVHQENKNILDEILFSLDKLENSVISQVKSSIHVHWIPVGSYEMSVRTSPPPPRTTKLVLSSSGHYFYNANDIKFTDFQWF